MPKAPEPELRTSMKMEAAPTVAPEVEPPEPTEVEAEPADMEPVVGRVKWFDATRGFGFVVSEALDGDILLHFSVLREHGRRSVPEGTLVECVPVRVDRGLQA